MKTPEESKRSDLRDLFQSILRDNVIVLSPVSVSSEEVFDKEESEVSFAFNERISGKSKKVSLRSVKGKGLVDCLFRGCKNKYSESYPSLKSVELVDFKVMPIFSMKKPGSRAETDIVLSVKVGDRGVSEFVSRSDSIIRSAFTTTLKAFQFYMNCEASFEKIKIVLDDASKRNRGDIQQRCLADLSKITEMIHVKV